MISKEQEWTRRTERPVDGHTLVAREFSMRHDVIDKVMEQGFENGGDFK